MIENVPRSGSPSGVSPVAGVPLRGLRSPRCGGRFETPPRGTRRTQTLYRPGCCSKNWRQENICLSPPDSTGELGARQGPCRARAVSIAEASSAERAGPTSPSSDLRPGARARLRTARARGRRGAWPGRWGSCTRTSGGRWLRRRRSVRSVGLPSLSVSSRRSHANRAAGERVLRLRPFGPLRPRQRVRQSRRIQPTTPARMAATIHRRGRPSAELLAPRSLRSLTLQVRDRARVPRTGAQQLAERPRPLAAVATQSFRPEPHPGAVFVPCDIWSQIRRLGLPAREQIAVRSSSHLRYK